MCIRDRDYLPSVCELGLCYEMGTGVEESKERAAELYRQAAQQGDARAQCNLGFCYYQGIGVEADDKQATEWFQKAADQDYLLSLIHI